MWGGAVGFSALPETPRPIFPVGILCCLLLLASLSRALLTLELWAKGTQRTLLRISCGKLR